MRIGICKWKGKSGKLYEFEMYTEGTTFEEAVCIYIYSHRTANSAWKPIYIGQTTQLQTRIRQHASNENGADKCIQKSGFTRIHICKTSASQLNLIEEDLLASYPWQCNIQVSES